MSEDAWVRYKTVTVPAARAPGPGSPWGRHGNAIMACGIMPSDPGCHSRPGAVPKYRRYTGGFKYRPRCPSLAAPGPGPAGA
eukprot:767955-Hanusia_phi.AAC.6